MNVKLLATVLVFSMIFPIASYWSFGRRNDESEGWVPKELESIDFPGGAVVVRRIQYNPFEEGYVSIRVEARIDSQEELLGYIGSRTKALDSLLHSVEPNSLIQTAVIFRNPLKAEEFADLCKTSLTKLGEYAIIVSGESIDVKGAEILWFPRPDEARFTECLTDIKEGYRLEGVIAAECLIEARNIRPLQTDGRVLLVDPVEDRVTLEIAEKYRSMGFSVKTEGVFSQEMWTEYVKLKHGVLWFSPAVP